MRSSGAQVIHLSPSDSLSCAAEAGQAFDKRIGLIYADGRLHVCQSAICCCCCCCWLYFVIYFSRYLRTCTVCTGASAFNGVPLAQLPARSVAFIYIRVVFGESLKLFLSEGIHQDGRGKTAEEQKSIGSTVHIRGNNSC